MASSNHKRRLEDAVTDALKWLLSHDPLSRVHARDILLGALGTTEAEFAERYKDQIIQPPISNVNDGHEA